MRYTHHVFVCTNKRPDEDPKGCCASKGSDELHRLFKEAIHSRGMKSKMRANKSGCLDACEFGPSVVVYPDGVWYGGVTPDDVDEIVEKHLIEGQPVRRLLIDHPRFTPPEMIVQEGDEVNKAEKGEGRVK